MLEPALSRTNYVTGLTVYADQVWHDKMQPYQAMRRATLSRKKPQSNCFDDATIESFFSTLNAEYFHLVRPDGIDTLVVDCNQHYDHERIKLGLQGLSPAEYRLRNTA